MARKRKLADRDILDYLEKLDEMSEVEDSASEDEIDNDYEANDTNESEQSAEESDDDDNENSNYNGKDGYVWSNVPKKARRTLQRNIVVGKPGPKNAAIHAISPEEAFGIFINNEMFTVITK